MNTKKLYRTIMWKAFLYSVFVTVGLSLFSLCSWLLTLPVTIANILGLILMTLTIAGCIIFGIREGKYYLNALNEFFKKPLF